MKVLIVDNSGLTQSENDFCLDQKTGEFAKELQVLGNTVTFYGQKFPPNTNNNHTFKIIENGLKVVGVKRRNNKLYNYILQYSRLFFEILKSDFVYFFYPTAFIFMPILCKIIGKKYGFYIRGMKKLDGFLPTIIFKHSYVIFTVSDVFTNKINTQFNHIKAYTIKPMMPYQQSDIVQNRILKKGSVLNVLFLGRFDKDKGIEELINTIEILKNKGHLVHLRIVGNGNFMDIAKELITLKNLEKEITLVGAIFGQDNIQKEFLASDVYVLPTYHEGFPRTLYEAMLTNTPIITTFVGGIPALMKHKINCLEIAPKSVDSIVEALEFTIFNYQEMLNFAKNGLVTISSVLDPKKATHAESVHQQINNTVL